jgi:membrane peptidoglycan carboxypeptidase
MHAVAYRHGGCWNACMRSFVAADRRRARRPRPWTTFVAAALGVAVSCWVPDVRPLLASTPASTAVMRARAAAPGEASAVAPTPLGELSPLLVCAIVKAEDRGFFFHHGFDPSQMLRGATATLRGHGPRGGSTITQQLAKNLYLSADRTWQRKAEEALTHPEQHPLEAD